MKIITKPQRKIKTTFGISFPNPDLLDQAKAKSAAYGISLSAYVNQLLRRDLGHAALTPSPSARPAPAPVPAPRGRIKSKPA
jgi:hypothetical protein